MVLEVSHTIFHIVYQAKRLLFFFPLKLTGKDNTDKY